MDRRSFKDGEWGKVAQGVHLSVGHIGRPTPRKDMLSDPTDSLASTPRDLSVEAEAAPILDAHDPPAAADAEQLVFFLSFFYSFVFVVDHGDHRPSRATF